MLTLHSLHLWLERPSGPLRPAIEAALAAHGTPLRWAITVAGDNRLLIEAVLVGNDGAGAFPQQPPGEPDGACAGAA